MKNLFKLMLLTITMFIAGSSFALAGNDNDSIQILEKANQGDPVAQNHYAYLLYKASKKEEAKEWFEASARQGVAHSQRCLGIFYSKGIGCKRDYKSAIKWYGKAADRGDSVARKHFFTTGDMFGKSEIPETKFQIFLHGTNKTLTCKGNELTFEEGEQNDDNTWTVETARDKSTGHYSPILKSLSGKYITGKERDNGPAGLGTIEEAADIEVGFPFPYPEKSKVPICAILMFMNHTKAQI